LSDIENDAIQQRLQLSRRAAETLGIYGTPALTIGRTLIMGDVPANVLDSIIEIETQNPFSGC
jgi:predicted DsbA family dithiol-disulfide isomerase